MDPVVAFHEHEKSAGYPSGPPAAAQGWWMPPTMDAQDDGTPARYARTGSAARPSDALITMSVEFEKRQAALSSQVAVSRALAPKRTDGFKLDMEF